ncbi:MAG: hypothetical protein MJZ36_01170 [Bacteroidaceae bacterium]|nr:hypothetical protein [Bacteroidaceae bacterium]
MITKIDFEFDRVANYMEFVPYDVTRKGLYTCSELYEGYSPDQPNSYASCYDQQVYQHFLDTGKLTDYPLESLARSQHDFFIRKAMNAFLERYEKKKVVGVMGGHGLSRADEMYRKVALISKRLTEQEYLMVTGGGPGAMEATHLGAWMAGRTDAEVDKAISLLAQSPTFRDEGWFESTFKVMQAFPQTKGYDSLGVPTWLYGHEPSTPFATQIAKLFENSVREDTILTITYGGLIFSPGSAGTMQEIFQEAVQDHYQSFGFSSPLVFLGTEFWTSQVPVYPFLEMLQDKGCYKNLLLSISDHVDEVVKILNDFK